MKNILIIITFNIKTYGAIRKRFNNLNISYLKYYKDI